MDPTPTGYITTAEAFRRFHKPQQLTPELLTGVNKKIWDDVDLALELILNACRRGELHINVFDQQKFGGLADLISEDYDGSFPERVFLDPVIAAHPSDHLHRYQGRTAIVNEVAFTAWLAHAKTTTTVVEVDEDEKTRIARRPATEQDEFKFRAFAKQLYDSRGLGPDYIEAENFAKDNHILSAREWSRKMIKMLPPEQRRQQGSGNPLIRHSTASNDC